MASGEQLTWLFFSLRGRISPSPYLLGGLMLFIVRLFLLYRFLQTEQGSSAQSGWALALLVALFISTWCNIALTSKRLHDFGKPALWALAVLAVDLLIFLVLTFVRGDPGPNRYGARTNAPA